MAFLGKEVAATLSITRRSNEEEFPVSLIVRTGNLRERLVIRMSLEDFAAALLGLSDRPCVAATTAGFAKALSGAADGQAK